jgi:hypothetical protein
LLAPITSHSATTTITIVNIDSSISHISKLSRPYRDLHRQRITILGVENFRTVVLEVTCHMASTKTLAKRVVVEEELERHKIDKTRPVGDGIAYPADLTLDLLNTAAKILTLKCLTDEEFASKYRKKNFSKAVRKRLVKALVMNNEHLQPHWRSLTLSEKTVGVFVDVLTSLRSNYCNKYKKDESVWPEQIIFEHLPADRDLFTVDRMAPVLEDMPKFWNSFSWNTATTTRPPSDHTTKAFPDLAPQMRSTSPAVGSVTALGLDRLSRSMSESTIGRPTPGPDNLGKHSREAIDPGSESADTPIAHAPKRPRTSAAGEIVNQVHTIKKRVDASRANTTA